MKYIVLYHSQSLALRINQNVIRTRCIWVIIVFIVRFNILCFCQTTIKIVQESEASAFLFLSLKVPSQPMFWDEQCSHTLNYHIPAREFAHAERTCLKEYDLILFISFGILGQTQEPWSQEYKNQKRSNLLSYHRGLYICHIDCVHFYIGKLLLGDSFLHDKGAKATRSKTHVC